MHPSDAPSKIARWKIGLLALAAVVLLVVPAAALANGTPTAPAAGTPAASEEGESGGKPSIGLIETVDSEAGRESGVGRTAGLPALTGRAISSVLGFVGVIFFVLMIYAGFLWMTAAGNEERVGKAKNIFVSSVIGLIIVIGAYYILDFVFDAIYSGIGTETATTTTD